MRGKMLFVSAGAVLAIVAAAPATSAAATPPDNGNCFSSFVNGGSLGGQVSGDPGGAQADGRELGGFLHDARGRC